MSSSSSNNSGGGGGGGGGDDGGGGGQRRANEAAIEQRNERARFLEQLENEFKEGLLDDTRTVKLKDHPETLELLGMADEEWDDTINALTAAKVRTIDDLVVWARRVHAEDEARIASLAKVGLDVFVEKLKDFYERYFPVEAQAHQAPDAKRARTGK